jgi:hypothetical protein
VLAPYRSELPDYLISIVNTPHMQIDTITKADELQVLRFDFLHYSLEELVSADTDPRDLIWLFTDPTAEHHLISRAPHPLLPPRRPRGP